MTPSLHIHNKFHKCTLIVSYARDMEPLKLERTQFKQLDIAGAS